MSCATLPLLPSHTLPANYVILQFGRTGTDTFTMDYQYPMSAVQVRVQMCRCTYCPHARRPSPLS